MPKISDLPQTGPITGAEQLVVVQAGATKRMPLGAFLEDTVEQATADANAAKNVAQAAAATATGAVDGAVQAGQAATAAIAAAQTGATGAIAAAQTSATDAIAAAGGAAVASAQVAVAAFDARRFESVVTPLFNGEIAENAEFGRFRTTSLQNLAGAGANALFAGSAGAGFLCDLPLEQYDILNRQPILFGNTAGPTDPRRIRCGYIPAINSNAANRRRFFFELQGESNRALLPFSPQLPRTARGPYYLRPRFDGTNGFLDVYDIGTATWYYGAATAPTAGWVGVEQLQGELGIGAPGGATIGTVPAAARQGINWARLAMRDLFFYDGTLSDAACEAIVNGADIAATVAAAGGTLRRHFPLVDANGLISTAATGTRNVTLSQQGTLLPGPNLRRQSAAAYLTIDRLRWPGLIVFDPETQRHRIRLTGRFSGLTGRMFCDVVSTESNGRLAPRFQVFPEIVGNAYAVWVDLPPGLTDFEQLQLRFESNPNIVGATHPFLLQLPAVEGVGQSEFGIGTGAETTDVTGNSATVVRPRGDLRKIWFAVGKQLPPDSGFTITEHGLLCPMLGISNAPDPMVIIGNALYAAGLTSAFVVCQTISGSSLIDLMDDSNGGRTSADYKARLGLAANRGRHGELLCSGRAIDWDAFFPQQHGIMRDVFQPFLQGRGWPNSHVTRVDFWLGDGSISRRAVNVLMPPNRFASRTGATNSDSNFEGQQRDDYRNWSHDLGYIVGCERIAHTLQDEVAGELSTVENTHPGLVDPVAWQGLREYAYYIAENLLLALGRGRYRGPRFVESVRDGTAPNKVIVRIGPPRPHPGQGLATVNGGRTGFSTTSGANVPPTPVEPIYPKIAGGNVKWNFEARISNASARGVDQVIAAAIISSDEVELTLASDRVGGQTTIWTLDGGPGRYPLATVSQNDWRAGILHYGATGHVDGTPETTGFSIAGSSQGVVLPA